MKKACVIGFPVSHSLSPKLHGWWLKKYGIDGSYTAMAVPADHVKDALKRLIDMGFSGCNITIPLKEAALSAMDEHDESCLMSGAVNTVVFNAKGKKVGYNSDGFGFVESLKSQHPHWRGERVVILGTGGASRGIIASLRAAGVEKFVLVNRTREKAEKIIRQFKFPETLADVVDWKHRAEALKDASLLINCSSLGMQDEDPLDLDLTHLPQEAAVCDIVYRPLQTDLLARAAARGHKTVEGLSMLLHQGRLGFDYWFGQDPEVTPELHAFLAGEAGL